MKWIKVLSFMCFVFLNGVGGQLLGQFVGGALESMGGGGIPPLGGVLDSTLSCAAEVLAGSQKHHPDVGLKIDEFLLKYGYPVEQYKVVTEDGYILTVFRVPFSPKFPHGGVRPPVYLNHGLLVSGLSWLVQTPGRNLGMMLADAGYDVFISNCRGSTYSQEHLRKSTSDPYYWDFSFHEMGRYDVPAVMDLITRINGAPKMFYIGHSMGCIQYFIAMSERPYLNDRIHTAFLLAPAIYGQHTASLIRLFAPLAYNAQYLFNSVLGGKLNQVQQLQAFTGLPLSSLCEPMAMACGVCGNLLFLFSGWDAPQTNYTQLPQIFGAFPDVAATKAVVHYAQGIMSGVFRQFDHLSDGVNIALYGTAVPPSYNISAVTAPTVLLYGLNDILAGPKDVQRLAFEMRPSALKLSKAVPFPLFSHMDFATGINATEWIYLPIINAMNTGIYAFP